MRIQAAAILVAAVFIAALPQLAGAQFIIQGVQFGGAQVSSEATTHDDHQDAVDSFNYQFAEGFQDLSEFAVAHSDVNGSLGRADALQNAGFTMTPGQFRIDILATTASVGQSTLALPGQRPNTSASNASGSFVITFEALERFELRIDGAMLASSFALGDSLSQLFIYDRNGVLVQAIAQSSGDQERDELVFNDRFILPPGQFVIELISLARQETFAFEDTGILNSAASANWLLTFDMRALPKPASARP